MDGNFRFKIDWASLIVGSKFTPGFALFYFVFEGNSPSTSLRGAYIWRGDFALPVGGAYTWRGLFSEFYGIFLFYIVCFYFISYFIYLSNHIWIKVFVVYPVIRSNQWQIQGRVPGNPLHLIFRPNWGPKVPQKIFFKTGPPPYLRVWMMGAPPYLKVWICHCY